MTPLDFLRRYAFDGRTDGGTIGSPTPLRVRDEERIGVVLLNAGGPRSLDEVQSFLYDLFMDPALHNWPVGAWMRHWLARAKASWITSSVQEEYEVIGGHSPLNRLTQEQAQSLQQHLEDRYGDPAGITFRTYVASRYGPRRPEETAEQMEDDGIDRVVLLPMYPQYSNATTGSFLAYWSALEESGEIPSWPTTSVLEYAANPKYVQAVSERIDEGLQRFPRGLRQEVHLLFSVHGAPVPPKAQHDDPYCCLVHATIDQIVRHRDEDRPFHTAFQSKLGLPGHLQPSVDQKLESLGEADVDAVLAVPVTFVTDHLETSHGLDIAARKEAETVGIDHFEVTTGLNTHPLFIEALGEAIIAQLDLPIDVNQLRLGGDGLTQDYPLRPISEMESHDSERRDLRCESCEYVAEARRWTLSDGVPDTEVVPREAEEDRSDTSAQSSESSASSS